MSLRLGVDVGGTKIAFALYRESGRELVHYETIPTRELAPGDVGFVKRLVAEITRRVGQDVHHVGVACKGVVHEGVVTFSSLMGGAVEYPLCTELRAVLPSSVLAVRVENDRYPLVIAERIAGIGRAVPQFSVVNIGTGLSIAHYDRGILRGVSSLAGEMGLAIRYIPTLKRACSIESIVSGSGLEALFQEEHGERRSAKDIFSAQSSDPRAAQMVELFQATLAQLLVDISYFLNPSRIVLHGSLTRSAETYLPAVCAAYASTVDSLSAGCIEVSTVEHANCLGAAFLSLVDEERSER